MNTPIEKKQILIVTHDAGGAELVSSWVCQHPENNYIFVTAGPAISIFKRKLGDFRNYAMESLAENAKIADLILTGTGWASDLEKMAIAIGKEQGKKTISFLDHWVNYHERFVFYSKLNLPDEIWVGDEYALEVARNEFPKSCIRLVANPYFEDIKQEIAGKYAEQQSNGKLRVLFISEPVVEHALKKYGDERYFGYTEYEMMEKLFDHLPAIMDLSNLKVRVRLHPMEDKNKYQSLLSYYHYLPIALSNNSLLVDDCLWANWVVGCESMALVIGLLAGKRVFSLVKRADRPISLPHKEIESFSERILQK